MASFSTLLAFLGPFFLFSVSKLRNDVIFCKNTSLCTSNTVEYELCTLYCPFNNTFFVQPHILCNLARHFLSFSRLQGHFSQTKYGLRASFLGVDHIQVQILFMLLFHFLQNDAITFQCPSFLLQYRVSQQVLEELEVFLSN